MNCKEAEIIARNLMAEHGVTDLGYCFRWSYSRTNYGYTDYGRKVISLSRPLTEHDNEANVIDTVLHEIAHALAGRGAGHGPKWKQIAKRIGAKPARLSQDSTAYNLIAKYKGVCPNGHESYRNRLPKHNVSCGRCCKVYNPDYIVRYERNERPN